MKKGLSMHRTRLAGSPSTGGYTLIELMIVVAVMGILAAIAIPMYTDYVTRGRIIDATTKLGDLRTQLEKCFMDWRAYNNAACPVPASVAAYNADPSASFTIAWPPLVFSATTYTLTAAGIPARGMSPFAYTIDQTNAKTTVAVKPGWLGAGNTCWVIRKDGSC
jgi:type IV pilus assembly protein PilE